MVNPLHGKAGGTGYTAEQPGTIQVDKASRAKDTCLYLDVTDLFTDKDKKPVKSKAYDIMLTMPKKGIAPQKIYRGRAVFCNDAGFNAKGRFLDEGWWVPVTYSNLPAQKRKTRVVVKGQAGPTSATAEVSVLDDRGAFVQAGRLSLYGPRRGKFSGHGVEQMGGGTWAAVELTGKPVVIKWKAPKRYSAESKLTFKYFDSYKKSTIRYDSSRGTLALPGKLGKPNIKIGTVRFVSGDVKTGIGIWAIGVSLRYPGGKLMRYPIEISTTGGKFRRFDGGETILETKLKTTHGTFNVQWQQSSEDSVGSIRGNFGGDKRLPGGKNAQWKKTSLSVRMPPKLSKARAPYTKKLGGGRAYEYTYYKRGEKKHERVRHGLYRRWWPNGKIHYENEYRFDKKHGISTNYNKTGKKISVYKYENNIKHGDFKTWDDDGNQVTVGAYKNGKRDGRWERRWRQRNALWISNLQRRQVARSVVRIRQRPKGNRPGHERKGPRSHRHESVREQLCRWRARGTLEDIRVSLPRE